MRGANLAAAFTVHSSFADIAARYNGFILDQFGVMHNGKHALDGASECVKRLHQDDKKCVILSNTSSLSQSTLDQLPNLGFDPSHFRGAVTSGEEASRYISQTFGRQPNNNEKQRNKKALWITWDKQKKPDPLDFFAACGNIDPTCDVEDADFILLHGCQTIRGKESEVCSSLGSFMETGQLHDIDPILKQCQKRGLPMVCANPDFIVVMSDGSTGHMPGKIARRYEEMGGDCKYFGKPHVPHFQACIDFLGLPKEEVVHVGDSIHHDIAGANAAGIDSVLITGGIHGEELGAFPSHADLNEFFQREEQYPTHIVPLFRF